MKTKHGEIKAKISQLIGEYYGNPEGVDAQYVFAGNGRLDPSRFITLAVIRTGFKPTTIDRYRRELEPRKQD